jgi:hypothetical protein
LLLLSFSSWLLLQIEVTTTILQTRANLLELNGRISTLQEQQDGILLLSPRGHDPTASPLRGFLYEAGIMQQLHALVGATMAAAFTQQLLNDGRGLRWQILESTRSFASFRILQA